MSGCACLWTLRTGFQMADFKSPLAMRIHICIPLLPTTLMNMSPIAGKQSGCRSGGLVIAP
jgi:hypothetical protein